MPNASKDISSPVALVGDDSRSSTQLPAVLGGHVGKLVRRAADRKLRGLARQSAKVRSFGEDRKRGRRTAKEAAETFKRRKVGEHVTSVRNVHDQTLMDRCEYCKYAQTSWISTRCCGTAATRIQVRADLRMLSIETAGKTQFSTGIDTRV